MCGRWLRESTTSSHCRKKSLKLPYEAYSTIRHTGPPAHTLAIITMATTLPGLTRSGAVSEEVEDIFVRLHHLHQLQLCQQLISLHTRGIVWPERERESVRERVCECDKPFVVLTATIFLSGMPGTIPCALACSTLPKEPSPTERGRDSSDQQLTLGQQRSSTSLQDINNTTERKPAIRGRLPTAAGHSGPYRGSHTATVNSSSCWLPTETVPRILLE